MVCWQARRSSGRRCAQTQEAKAQAQAQWSRRSWWHVFSALLAIRLSLCTLESQLGRPEPRPRQPRATREQHDTRRQLSMLAWARRVPKRPCADGFDP